MPETSKYDISIEKLMNVVHSHTDPIRIQVVMGDAWMTCEEAKKMKDFTLVECFRGDNWDEEDKKTGERLLKYYKDCPVWNLTVWVDIEMVNSTYHPSRKGHGMLMGIEARCHYKDIRNGWLAEQADIKREKQRAYRERRKNQNNK